MMERKTDILVGSIVTLALLVLILGVIWGKRIEFFSSRIWLTVRFEDVRGLEKGDPVFVRGTRQGEVDRIDLYPEYAEVRLWIRKEVSLFSDLRVFIEGRELMGGKQVTIEPGRSRRYINFSKVLHGEVRADLGELLGSMGDVVSRMDSIFGQLDRFLKQDRFDRIIQNVEETTDQAKEILVQNRQGIRLAVKQLEEMSRKFRKDSTAVRMGRVVTRLDSTVILVNQVVDHMNKNNGTVGKLLQERKLYDQLIKTSADLDSLVTDIKANPKKYIHVSIF